MFEEKEEAFLHYMKYGYHHPSMTKEVEENAALTELNCTFAPQTQDMGIANV
jgi:hypothetical protein